jgi:thiol-disulfide isomerase/thioredoxin
MRRLSHFKIGLMLATLVTVSTAGLARQNNSTALGVALPAFTQSAPDAWINSPPLTVENLRGTVVLVDFWAFECWNCYRSFPWLKTLEARFSAQDFTVVGVHSPEFERERKLDKVRAKVAEFGLTHPVMIDNDFAFWRAVGNRYWPAYHLVDKQGMVRQVFVGETHAGDAQAQQIESAVATLLAE